MDQELKLQNIRFEELEFGNVLGEGSCGLVKEAVFRGEKVAAKKIDSASLGMEAISIRVPSHKNILRMIAYANDPHENDKLWLVMERMDTDLDSYMKTTEISLSEALGIMLEVAQGMYHFHKNNIVHRDLKPHNVLLRILNNSPKLVVKIADFGTAKFEFDTRDEKLHTLQKGTTGYMAPEMLGRGDEGEHTRKTDVYSFGATGCQLVTGKLPSAGMTKLREKSDSLSKLIIRCLDSNPERRPSFQDICELIWTNADNCTEPKPTTADALYTIGKIIIVIAGVCLVVNLGVTGTVWLFPGLMREILLAVSPFAHILSRVI